MQRGGHRIRDFPWRFLRSTFVAGCANVGPLIGSIAHRVGQTSYGSVQPPRSTSMVVGAVGGWWRCEGRLLGQASTARWDRNHSIVRPTKFGLHHDVYEPNVKVLILADAHL